MRQTPLFKPNAPETVQWEASHEAANKRLSAFIPRAGIAYARLRNFDLGPANRNNVSALSPWVRHRLILEEEIVHAALTAHNLLAAEKFIQEVFWRGYFKGWLEHRPQIWTRYTQNLTTLVGKLENDASLAQRYEEAISSKTGIACFDAWAAELITTGYLHNHARMWFASIWIFTLNLPWELGADFFYRHLLDGDPAANTCSWRWVAGLHTVGKTYLARASNIEKFTEGRFNPEEQLAKEAPPLSDQSVPLIVPTMSETPNLSGQRIGLLMTEEDCSPHHLNLSARPSALLALSTPTPRSILPTSALVSRFSTDAVTSAATTIAANFDIPYQLVNSDDWANAISAWASQEALDCIVTPRVQVGSVQCRLRSAMQTQNVPLIEITRRYDAAVWPHAKRGFFGLKKKIPEILARLNLN